ncbi:MAG TPA: hypothetical protein VMU81_03135 [Acetobacteraceae bacterium]|nr:hypothetical protein [Acetobacteraceae bacterium]
MAFVALLEDLRAFGKAPHGSLSYEQTKVVSAKLSQHAVVPQTLDERNGVCRVGLGLAAARPIHVAGDATPIWAGKQLQEGSACA